MCVRRAFRYFPEIHLFYTRTINLWLGAFPTDGFKSCVCSAPWWFTAHCTCWICMWTYHCFPFTTKIMLNMLCYMHFGTVNSLVSDYPWFTTKWSLTGGCHLWEKKRRISQISAPRRGCGHIRNLRDFLKLYLHKVFAYGRWFLMRNGHKRNDCIKGQLNKTRKKEMGVFVIGY